MEPSCQRSLRLAQTDPGAQPAHHFQPVKIVIEESALFIIGRVRCQQRGRVQGQVYLGICLRVHPKEPGRGNSHNGERRVVNQDLPSYSGRARGEAALPVPVAENRHGRRPAAIVLVRDQAPGGGRHAESVIKPARDELPVGNFRLILRHQVDFPSRGIGKQGAEWFRVRAQQLKNTEGIVGTGRYALVPMPASVLAVNHRRMVVGAPVEHHQLLRVLYRQRAQQDRIHEAIDRGVRPNAQRQR